jgi:hypothetical protein
MFTIINKRINTQWQDTICQREDMRFNFDKREHNCTALDFKVTDN